MNGRLDRPLRALHLTSGLTATLAGLDRFFGIWADWTSYVSPLAAGLVPFFAEVLRGIVGGVEVGVADAGRRTAIA